MPVIAPRGAPLPYEIRIVFQTIEAYQSAIDRLYAVFGVALPPPEPSPNGAGEGAEEPSPAVVELSEEALSQDPPTADQPYSFVVEDRTR